MTFSKVLSLINESNKKSWHEKLKEMIKKVSSPRLSSLAKEIGANEDLQMIENLKHFLKLKNKENFFGFGFGKFLKLLLKMSFDCMLNKNEQKGKTLSKWKRSNC